MTTDRLWAPWRIAYIAGKKQKTCIFCAAVRQKDSRQVVIRSRHAFSLLNIYPYNNGHMMICPLRHTRDFDSLTLPEVTDLFQVLKRTKKLLDRHLHPHGYNIGINLGEAAGAGITNHLHIHLVPRWRGDTNFMPTTASTRVISQSLKELYQRLTTK